MKENSVVIFECCSSYQEIDFVIAIKLVEEIILVLVPVKSVSNKLARRMFEKESQHNKKEFYQLDKFFKKMVREYRSEISKDESESTPKNVVNNEAVKALNNEDNGIAMKNVEFKHNEKKIASNFRNAIKQKNSKEKVEFKINAFIGYDNDCLVKYFKKNNYGLLDKEIADFNNRMITNYDVLCDYNFGSLLSLGQLSPEEWFVLQKKKSLLDSEKSKKNSSDKDEEKKIELNDVIDTIKKDERIQYSFEIVEVLDNSKFK